MRVRIVGRSLPQGRGPIMTVTSGQLFILRSSRIRPMIPATEKPIEPYGSPTTETL